MSMNKPVMEYHGGKFRLAPWIISFFPKHHCYVEPFGGAAGVLMQKPRSEYEVYNDLDSKVVNVFRILQDKEQAHELERRLRVTPYARQEFNIAYEDTDCHIENARRMIIRSYMGFGSASANKNYSTTFRCESTNKGGKKAHAWAKYPDRIVGFTERLKAVVIENKPALDVIDNHDREDTLFYLDPPYLQSTRSSSSAGYMYEMNDQEHIEMLERLTHAKGFVILSGHDSEIYHKFLEGWEVKKTKHSISGNKGTSIRTECVWLNPACAKQQPQQQLFTS